MTDLRTVKVPLLERVILEELADRWQITTDEALTRLIRNAAVQEVVLQSDDHEVEAQEVSDDEG